MIISNDTIRIGSAGGMILCALVFLTMLVPEWCNDWFNNLSIVGKLVMYGILVAITFGFYMLYRRATKKSMEENNDEQNGGKPYES